MDEGALVVQYTDSPGNATRPACELTLMMRPNPWANMCRAANWLAKKVPLRFTATVASKSASVTSRGGCRGDTCVVHQDVEVAEFLGGLRHSCLDLGEVGDVERDLHHPASALVDFGDEVVGGVRTPKSKRDIGTCISQRNRDRTTETASRAGDKRRATAEVERLLGNWAHHSV